jgi:hypothetical protein
MRRMSALHKFHEPIGALAVSFSQLETLVMLFVVGLIDVDPNVGMALVSEMSFAKRLDALQSIAPFTIRDTTLCDELAEVVAHLSESENQRNTILHTTWALSGQSEVMRLKPTAKRKKGLKANFRTASVDDVVAAREQITATITKFSAYIRKIQDRGILKLKICQ